MSDKRFDKLEEKLDKIDDRINGVDVILARQEANLSEHMRRSDLLETLVADIEDEIKPMQKHISMIEGALKLLGALGIAIGVLYSILNIFEMI